MSSKAPVTLNLSDVNAKHYTELRSWIDKVNADPILKPVSNGAVSLSANQGASYGIFDFGEYTSKLAKQQDFVVTGTLDWVSPFDGPSSNVKIDSKRLKAIVRNKWPNGRLPPNTTTLKQFEVRIGVTDPSWNPMRHIGAMPRISSCEDIHQLWFAMYLACTESQAGDVDNKQMWAKLRRNICYRFELLTEEQIVDGVEFVNAQIREDRSDDAHLVTWDPVQRVQFVMSQKVKLASKKSVKIEAISVPILFNHFKKLKIATRTVDEYKEGFLQAANLVASKMLALLGTYALLEELETVIDSVYQLQLIIQGAKQVEADILHVLAELGSQFKAGVLTKDDFSQRKVKTVVEILLVQKSAPGWAERWMTRQ